MSLRVPRRGPAACAAILLAVGGCESSERARIVELQTEIAGLQQRLSRLEEHHADLTRADQARQEEVRSAEARSARERRQVLCDLAARWHGAPELLRLQMERVPKALHPLLNEAQSACGAEVSGPGSELSRALQDSDPQALAEVVTGREREIWSSLTAALVPPADPEGVVERNCPDQADIACEPVPGAVASLVKARCRLGERSALLGLVHQRPFLWLLPEACGESVSVERQGEHLRVLGCSDGQKIFSVALDALGCLQPICASPGPNPPSEDGANGDAD